MSFEAGNATEDEMAGWHHWLDGRESEWTPGVGDGQGGLACCDSWGRKESDMTEWLIWSDLSICDTSESIPRSKTKEIFCFLTYYFSFTLTGIQLIIFWWALYDYFCWLTFLSFKQFTTSCKLRSLTTHILCQYVPNREKLVLLASLWIPLFRPPLSTHTEKAMAPLSSTLAWKIPWTESLVGCSPWGRWESDTTERLHFHFSLSCIGEGNGNPLQCSCLENPRYGGSWWAAIYGVAQSQTRLKRLSSSSSSKYPYSYLFFLACNLYYFFLSKIILQVT